MRDCSMNISKEIPEHENSLRISEEILRKNISTSEVERRLPDNGISVWAKDISQIRFWAMLKFIENVTKDFHLEKLIEAWCFLLASGLFFIRLNRKFHPYFINCFNPWRQGPFRWKLNQKELKWSCGVLWVRWWVTFSNYLSWRV